MIEVNCYIAAYDPQKSTKYITALYTIESIRRTTVGKDIIL